MTERPPITRVPEPLYAISLWQPWASLIAIGAKPFETRHWFPPKWLIGHRIAIHAAKTPVPLDAEDQEDFTAAFGGKGWRSNLPKGAIVCTAILAGAYQCGDSDADPKSADITRSLAGSRPLDKINIDSFGDYTPLRVAWWLTDIERIEPPILASGRQGFWKWQP